jgi:nicotinamide-nucleotide amidase
MPSKVVEDCAKLLAAQELNIAFAESATVGRMAAEFGLTDEAGKILKGGIVCYDAGVKEDLLKVDDKLVEDFTPESAEVTEAAAKGLRALMPAKIHVAITGLTCPGGSESPEKPVGTMFIHCISDNFEFSDRSTFTGGKEVIIMKCIENFADLLSQKISPAK